MKLFYTPNSPYARIARVAALELNLGGQIEMQKVTVRQANSQLLNYNPTGKVPTLETDDKFILSETRIICAYLNRFNNDIKLVADISDASSLQLEGMVGGFLDGIAVWVREIRRPPGEQSQTVIELERLRALRCLEHFEKLSHRLDQRSKLGYIMLSCTLGIMEARLREFQWRQKHLRLANWYHEFSTRPSMQATVPDSQICGDDINNLPGTDKSRAINPKEVSLMTAHVDIDKYKQQVITDFNSRLNYDEGNKFHLALANRLIELAQLQQGQKVLDIATGTGLVAITAAQIVGSLGQVVGVDISKGMLEQAQRKINTIGLKNVELIEADADSLNFHDSSFDIILCSSAIVYLTDIRDTLKQWHRFLKPGGLVAFSCFAETAHTLAVIFREKAQTYGISIPNPNQPFGTPQKCQNLLIEAGFQDIKVVTEQFGSYVSDVERAWSANARSAFGFQVKELSSERLEQLKAEYIAEVEATATDKGIWNDVTTFFVLGSSKEQTID